MHLITLSKRPVLLTGLCFLVAGMHLTALAQTTLPYSPPKGAAAVAALPAQPEAAAGRKIRALLHPNGEATLGSQRLGRVVQLPANIGTPFTRGQLLVELDCSEPRAQIDVLKVELAGAVETYEAKLVLKGLEQASDIEVALAASAVQKIKAQIKQLSVQVDQCTVTAPWAGWVTKVHVRSFSTVNPGMPLLDLVRSGPLRVRMNVPSDLAGTIRAGSRFSVRVDETGKDYEGRLIHLNAKVDPVSQILEVEGQLDRVYPGLLPGMSGEATFSVVDARAR